MNDFAKAAELMRGSAPSPFQAAAEELKRRQAGQVGMVLAYDERDPDEAARNAVIGRDLGVSPLLVDAEPEAYDLRLRMQKAAETLRNAPKTAAWLSDMGNGVLAKDDLDNLSWFERMLRAPAEGLTEIARAIEDTQAGRGFRTGVTGMKQMGTAATTIPVSGSSRALIDRLTIYDKAQGLDPDMDRLAIAEALGVDPQSYMATLAYDFVRGDADRRQKHVDRAVNMLAANKELMAGLVEQVNAYSAEMQKTQGRVPNFTDIGDVKDFADWFAFNTGQAIPYLGAIVAAGGVGGPTGIAATGYGMGVGDIQANLIEQGITDKGGVALVGGVPYAALEYLGPAASLFRGVSSSVLSSVAKSWFRRLGRDIPQQAIEEFINEAGQEIINDLSTAAGGGKSVTLDDETLKRWFNAGMAGAAAGAGMAPLVTSSDQRMTGDAVKAAEAGVTAERLSSVDAQAMASKLRERAPEKFKEALDAQGLGDQAIYVPADALKEYFQAKDAALDEETMRAWGVDPLTFEEAAQSGNDVAIPMSNYATYIAGTENAPWFAENATSDPEEMSIAAVKAFNASVQDIMQEAFDEAERARLADEETRASDVQIYDQMLSQLRAAGRSPDVAQNEARIWSAFWRTMGERYGEDPLDLARSMGVQVRGPQSPEFRRRDALDIALNTLRTKGTKALQPRGMSLAEFVKSKGGIQDTGGDVAAMEPPKGVVAETSKEIRARQSQPTLDAMPVAGKGMSLEDMGRMAAEAGYFPDLMGEVNAGTNKGEATDFAARLLAALSEDVAGRKVYVEGEGPDADLQALSDALSERGIDLATMTNDEIVAALEAADIEAADGRVLNQISPEQARLIDMPVEMPVDPVFAEAVANTPGAQITDEGLLIDLVRFQKPEQAGTQSVRTGVFYLPVGSANVKHYKKGGQAGQWYGGPSAVQGQTLIKRPLFVKGATGGKAPEAAYNAIKGKGAAAKLSTEARAAAIAPKHMKDEVVYDFLERHGADPDMAWQIIENSKLGNQLTYALQENVIAHAAREAGYDAVIGYSKGKSGPFISEVFDVREIDYPTQGETAELHPHFEAKTFSQSAALKTDTPEFRAWFGDSKVVDENGEPLVVYHGTRADGEFDAFDPDEAHSSLEGFWFSNDEGYADWLRSGANSGARRKGGAVMPVYLRIEKPVIYDVMDEGKRIAKEIGEPEPQTIEDAEAILKGPDGYNDIVSQLQFENPDADGVIIRMAMDGFHRAADQYIAFSPTQIKSVYNRGTFDPNDPRILYQPGKRGSIVLPSGGLGNGQTVINLFETADLSSFLHESGHFFLEAFNALASEANAPQAMKDDMATILDWFGVKDWSEVGVKQHEQWARGFEAYAMEGKAPSLALADAFSRFKAWLTRIYRSLAGLNVKITPEIREVMDRMLATDAEIAEARAEMEMRPLFASAPPGMSEGDFATYQRMARRATETAEQALLEKTMAKVRREKEAWYRHEKQATRAEVATEYDRRREYRLIDMLANQLWHGLDENGEARTVPDVQIDRKMLVDQFGDGVLAEISRNRLGGKRAIYGDNGSSPEEVAQFFGFASASEMISILQNTPKKRDAVAMETERRMTERHGDPLNDGSIEEEALAAIHNEQQANTAVAEARHMARQLGRPVNGMTAKLYRQRARAMIGRMAVRDAIRVERFLASERKAARAAQDAFAKVARGTKAEAALAEALQAKEQQILNGFLYDEARQIAAEVQRGREKMRAYDKKSVREKLEGGYIEQIDAILADYDFRVRSQRQIARAESLKAFVDRMIEEGREGDLHIDMRLMDEAHRKHYTRLSVDDLRGLFDTIDNIDHLGRFKQKLIDRKRRRDLAESASRVAGQVRENIGTGKAGEKSRLAAAFNLLWRTDTLLARMDGGQEIGPAYDEIKRGIDEAVSEEQAMHVDMAKRLDGLFKEHYSAADLRKMKVERDIPGGNGRAWSKMEILAVALNTGNEDNFARLTANDAAVRNRLTREHVDALLATLDENDWRFVQGMWDMVNSYWPGLAEVAKRRTGVTPKKVEAKLMVNAPAFVTGGYFPIKYDPELSAAAATDEASGWDKFTATGRGATAAVRNGMTMQRQKTGNGRTLRLDMSVAFAHMRDTIRYIALSEAVDNTYRLVSHPDVVNAFLDAGAKDQHTILRLWLKDVASGPAPSPDALNTASRILKNNFTLSRLALNFKTVALQVTGVGQSAVVIGKRNMIRGYMEYLQNPYGTAQSVVEKSAFMKERQSTFQKDIYDFMDDTQIAGPLSSGYKKAKSVLAKIGFAPIVWTQFWAVDMPTWLGAFRTGIEKYGDEAKAIHFADRMVARAQDSGLMADRAAFERGTLSESVRQSDFVRLFTTLGGYMLTKMNRAYVLSMQTKADFRSADTGAQKVAIALSAATDVALLYLTEAVLVALVFAAMSDDEDDEDVAKFLLRETGSAAVGGMPLIRDAYAGLMGYGGGGIYGSLAEAPANFIRQVAQGENDAALRRSIADMIGMVTGLPTTGPMRAIEGALDEDVPLSEAVFGRNPLGR